MISTLTPPLQATFQILGNRSTTAAIPALEFGMRSSIPGVRIASVQTLLSRGGAEEMRTIVRCIDHCTAEEQSLLLGHTQLLHAPVEAALSDRSPEANQQGLVAVAKLRLASLFHRIVRVVENPEDPQQIVATQLLDGLATDFGSEARKHVGLTSNPWRDQLLADLDAAVHRYPKNRVGAILDSFLLASHWDDTSFRAIFSPIQSPSSAALLKRLKTIHRSEAIELLCGALWSKLSTVANLELLMERDPTAVLESACLLTRRFGDTPVLRKNLSAIPLPCLHGTEALPNDLKKIDMGAYLLLLGASDVTPDVVLKSVVQAYVTNKNAYTHDCVNAIRTLGTLKAPIVTMVMSDCFSLPDIDPYEAPPWKASMRAALEDLLTIYFDLPSPLRAAVDSMLSEFRCEELFTLVDTWPEAHVRAFGRVAGMVDPHCAPFLEAEYQSTSIAKRAKAIRMLRFLGKDERLQTVAIEALGDQSEAVRIQAIQSVAFVCERETALELLGPLLGDEDISVHTAASIAIEELQDAPK